MATDVRHRVPAAGELLASIPSPGWFTRQVKVWRRKKIGLASLLAIVLLLILALAGPLLATHDPLENNMRAVLAAPSSQHFFGTDSNGRDVYSRILYGARISVFIGFTVVLVAATAGALIGTLSAYAGGALDFSMQRVVDAVMAIPGLVLLLALVSVMQPSIPTLIVALSIAFLPGVIRVVRAEVLVVRECDYAMAARALGASSLRIMLRHVLPNVMAPLIIMATVTVGAAIMAEASLSFLGLGIPPPHPTWGNMLSGPGRQYMTVAPWLVLAPGLAITITILSFNMLGDALRDILDPRLRGA
jgi:peptide/nickel transport system permease protein